MALLFDTAAADRAACRALLRDGSKSFDAAARLLPAAVREPAVALYAFCREADDVIDSGGGSLDWLRERLHLAYEGRPLVLPDLEQHVISSKLMTPLDFRDRLCAWQGAAFGLEPVLLQSAWFRPHNRSEDIDGLYLVGAGTHPGAGVPGVLSSAKVLDRVVPHAAAL